MRDNPLARHILHRHLPTSGKRVRWRDEQHELVAANRHLEQPFLRRVKRERAEIEAALLHFDRNLPRGHAPHVNRDLRVTLAEPGDQREQRMHCGFVGADEDPAAPKIAELTHRRFGLLGKAHQPLAVVLEHATCIGQRSALRGSVEQLFTEIGLQPAHGLAHRRLSAVDLRRGARKAPLVGHREKNLQGLEVHGVRRLEPG